MKKVTIDILHDISEKITLVQLMDSVGNVDHEVIIVRYWIFISRKALPWTLDSLSLICSPLVGEVMFSVFETVFH